jgi:hypothetical protein
LAPAPVLIGAVGLGDAGALAGVVCATALLPPTTLGTNGPGTSGTGLTSTILTPVAVLKPVGIGKHAEPVAVP